jgi:hypothetical protein
MGWERMLLRFGVGVEEPGDYSTQRLEFAGLGIEYVTCMLHNGLKKVG